MDILRLLMVAALAACAPSLVGFGEIPDAPAVETSGGDSTPTDDAGRPDVAPDASDAADGGSTPDVAPVIDVAAEAATPDAMTPPDAAEVSVDAAPVGDATAASDARGDVDPCGGECANRPHTTRSECAFAGRCLVWCAPGFADCDQLGSNGCEVDLNNRNSCGGCSVRCGDARFCFNGGCRPL